MQRFGLRATSMTAQGAAGTSPVSRAWVEAQAPDERVGEVVVAASDRLAHPERVFCLQRQAPGARKPRGTGRARWLARPFARRRGRRRVPGVRGRHAQAGRVGSRAGG